MLIAITSGGVVGLLRKLYPLNMETLTGTNPTNIKEWVTVRPDWSWSLNYYYYYDHDDVVVSDRIGCENIAKITKIWLAYTSSNRTIRS